MLLFSWALWAEWGVRKCLTSHVTALQGLEKEALTPHLPLVSHTGSDGSFVLSVREQCQSILFSSCLHLFFLKGATDLIDVVKKWKLKVHSPAPLWLSPFQNYLFEIHIFPCSRISAHGTVSTPLGVRQGSSAPGERPQIQTLVKQNLFFAPYPIPLFPPNLSELQGNTYSDGFFKVEASEAK